MTKNAKMAMRCLGLVLLGMFLFAASQRGYGQDINASLSGTVSDPSGAVVPGAKLTLVNESTGFQSSYVSDPAGAYSFGNLTPGKYDLTATAPGFKEVSQKGIELLVAQRGHSDIHLTVGQTDQTVEVSADTSLINFETPDPGRRRQPGNASNASRWWFQARLAPRSPLRP